MIVYVFVHRGDFHPLRWSNISRGLTWDILKLSIPAALATIVMMFGFALFTKIVERRSTRAWSKPSTARPRPTSSRS